LSSDTENKPEVLVFLRLEGFKTKVIGDKKPQKWLMFCTGVKHGWSCSAVEFSHSR
ncbi:hypothetical protein HispidOSU_008013, partial [Sigmodon hispidus]